MLGTFDAKAHDWFDNDVVDGPWVQTTPERVKRTILAALGVALVVYGHFVVTVINDICDFYQIK